MSAPVRQEERMNCIQPVAVHLIGADRDDLTYLRDVEEGSVFVP